MKLNSKQRKTLEAVFGKPTKTNIKWNEVVNLLIALGVKQGQGSGSRVFFIFGNEKLAMHKPHPANTIKRYVVEDIRDFLRRINVTL